MPLYTITKEIVYVLEAKDSTDAFSATENDISMDTDGMSVHTTISNIKTVNDLPQSWDPSFYPFKTNDADPQPKTIGELLTNPESIDILKLCNI